MFGLGDKKEEAAASVNAKLSALRQELREKNKNVVNRYRSKAIDDLASALVNLEKADQEERKK